ncbi:hypothetical protein GIB67_015612 [Kingdonia uniflora]|uniref:Uncharacterized protein n=1 Tax=Kingdonia uniflora TaxID=39325 RepID=A0A7J7NUC3_9MAGN|nr:hypothetical protein GIB67_015612 [Kingdonia uniflora]
MSLDGFEIPKFLDDIDNENVDDSRPIGSSSQFFLHGNSSSSNASSSRKKSGLARSLKPLPNGKNKKIGKCYDISHVAWFDLREKIKDAWKRYKYYLNTTFIVGNNPVDVKASSAPEFVPREHWVKFVDYCDLEKLLAKSKKNKENRAKLITPCTSGRTSMPITRHKAEESGLTNEEICRVEMYIPAYTKKDQTIQYPDVIVKLQNNMRKDPKSIRTGPMDVIAQKFCKERKGRTWGIGTGMSIPFVEKVGHIVNKNEELRSDSNEMKSTTEKLRKYLDALTKYVGNIPVVSPTDNLRSQQATSSSQREHLLNYF